MEVLVGQVSGDGQSGAACAQDADLSAGLQEVTLGNEGVQSQTGGDGILCVCAVLTVQLGDAGQFAEALCVRIAVVEHILTCVVHVDLVGGDQSAHGQLVVLDELSNCAVLFVGCVDADVDALDDGIDAQSLSPDGEDLHNGRLAGGNTDEVQSGACCLFG